jgi:YHS domain-containing protein
MPWDTILTIIVVGAIFYLLMSRVGCGAAESGAAGGGCCGGHAHHERDVRDKLASENKGSPTAVRDPVCGMTIFPEDAAATIEYRGTTTYHFCSLRCRDQFIDDPVRFVSNAALAAGGRHEHS